MPESRLRAVVNTAIDGIILMDGQGVVTMCNPACERMFGYAASEIVGADVKQLMPQPYRDEHDSYLENYRRTGAPKIIGIGREVMGRRRDGETFPMELSVGAAEQNGETFYVGILRDVTPRKRIDELREQLIEELTASNEERGYFANIASHDLREHLRMVTTFCGLLSENYGDRLDERGREYLTIAVSAAKQMRDLLDDLVDFGRLGLEIDRESWFESEEIVRHVLVNLGESVQESGARVTYDALPRLYGNAIRFSRLVQNLLGNALKYVAPDVAPHIHISALRDGDFWEYSIRDNGIGIEPRHFDQIFEPFKRLHGKDSYAGSGLGLAICRRIVEGFGGKIWVNAAPGVGSTFSFTIGGAGRASEPRGSDDG